VHSRLSGEAEQVEQQRDRARRRLTALLDAARSDVEHVRARVRTLSPQATLERGYAVVQLADGSVVRDPRDATGRLRVRVARGQFEADVAEH
jgi:exodeoxyribonuclease VII large subunit